MFPGVLDCDAMTGATITTGACIPVSQVCEELGLSYRQLDYWCRKGWLGPDVVASGSGFPRCFTDQHLARGHVIVEALAEIRTILEAADLPSTLVRVNA